MARRAEVALSSSAPGDVLENPLHNTGATADLLPDHVNAMPLVPQLQYARFDRWLDAPASQLHAICPCAGQPCIHPHPRFHVTSRPELVISSRILFFRF